MPESGIILSERIYMEFTQPLYLWMHLYINEKKIKSNKKNIKNYSFFTTKK